MSNPLNQRLRRIALVIVLPAAIVIVALLPMFLYPSPASHPSLRDHPNGVTPQVRLALSAAVLAGVAAIAMCMLAFRRRASHSQMYHQMTVAGLVGGLITWTVGRALDDDLVAVAWRQADPLGFGLILLSLLVLFGIFAVIARYSLLLQTSARVSARDLPSAGLAPGARAVWVGTARGAWAIPTASMFLAFSLMAQKPGLQFFHFALGLLCLLLASVRVTVDRNGVRIAYGVLGWPVQRVRLAQIRQASMLQLTGEWSGWGYQGLLKLMQGSVVLRAGEGIRLDLAGDRTLVITVDGAEQGAGVVNDLLAAMKREGEVQVPEIRPVSAR